MNYSATYIDHNFTELVTIGVNCQKTYLVGKDSHEELSWRENF